MIDIRQNSKLERNSDQCVCQRLKHMSLWMICPLICCVCSLFCKWCTSFNSSVSAPFSLCAHLCVRSPFCWISPPKFNSKHRRCRLTPPTLQTASLNVFLQVKGCRAPCVEALACITAPTLWLWGTWIHWMGSYNLCVTCTLLLEGNIPMWNINV